MSENSRKIITRMFIETGKDGMPGAIEYADRLERCIMYTHKFLAGRKQTLRRVEIREALQGISRRIGYNQSNREFRPYRLDLAENGSGLNVILSDGDWARSEAPHELVTLDFDATGNLINVEVAAYPVVP